MPMSRTIIPKIFLAAFGVVLFWAFVTPVFEFPDEQAHFGTVTYFSQKNALPTHTEPDLTLEMYTTQSLLGTLRNDQGNNKYTYHPEYRPEYSDTLVGPYEREIIALNTPASRHTYVGSEAAKYPPLYYVLLTPIEKLVGQGSILDRLFALRALNVVFTGFLASLAYLFGRAYFGTGRYARVLAAIVIFQPMLSFVGAGVNSDNLHNLLSSILLLCGVLIIKNGLTLKLGLLSALALLLDIYTKPQAFINFFILCLAILESAIKTRRYRPLQILLILAVIILLVGYDQLSPYLGLLTQGNVKNISFVEFVSFSLHKLVAQNIVWYWGVFKWLGVVLPPLYWQIANRVVLLSALGLGIYAWKAWKKHKIVANPYLTLYLLLAALGYALAILWYDYQHFKLNGFSLGIQARYFFPSILAHLSLLLTGILSFGHTVRLRRILSVLTLTLFVCLQLGGLWRLISVYYDVTPLSTLLQQLSQYKPILLKGNWWYVWGGLYLVSFLTLVKIALTRGSSAKRARSHK